MSQQAQITQSEAERSAYLDFCHNQMTRPHRRPRPLKPKLIFRILEQLVRRRTLSAFHFLLLPRFKESGLRNGHTEPIDALRHELTDLRDFIEFASLAIEIEHVGGRLKAKFDRTKLGSNVWDARHFAREAAVRLVSTDFAGAVRYAESALTLDPDSADAASLVVEVLKLNQDILNDGLVTRAENRVARAMFLVSAAIQRLAAFNRQDRDTMKAQRLGRAWLRLLQRQWHELQSWPFCESPSERPDHGLRTLIKIFVETAIDARLGDSRAAYGRFAKDPFVAELVDRLLDGRLSESNPHKRQEIVNTLTMEIFAKLLMNGWVIPAVTSLEEFYEDVIKFLRRRLDWNRILNRGGGHPGFGDDGEDGNDEDGDDDDE